jgi:hypothetical protein
MPLSIFQSERRVKMQCGWVPAILAEREPDNRNQRGIRLSSPFYELPSEQDLGGALVCRHPAGAQVTSLDTVIHGFTPVAAGLSPPAGAKWSNKTLCPWVWRAQPQRHKRTKGVLILDFRFRILCISASLRLCVNPSSLSSPWCLFSTNKTCCFQPRLGGAADSLATGVSPWREKQETNS